MKGARSHEDGSSDRGDKASRTRHAKPQTVRSGALGVSPFPVLLGISKKLWPFGLIAALVLLFTSYTFRKSGAGSLSRVFLGEGGGRREGSCVPKYALMPPGDHPTPPDDKVPAIPRNEKDIRVAICLVGGARDFELTWPSILQRLLIVYPGAHLFINTPLDDMAYKLYAVAWSQRNVTVGAIRVFPNSWVDENKYPPGLVNDSYAPAGNQGIFQYMRMVEGCLDLVSKYEKLKGFRFNWILRTRVDTYWSGNPPPLSEFKADAYNIPYGTDCLGLNDRLGIGTWRTTRFAMARLSMLPLIHSYRSNLSQLNSEKAFQAQMDASCTPVARAHFPFCVLSRRIYSTDLMPVASLQSTSPLNGAKCRPCTPWLSGWKADRALRNYKIGAKLDPITTGVDLCYARVGWEHNWMDAYDKAAGPILSKHRKLISTASFHACVTHLAQLQHRAGLWDAPMPHVFCFRRLLGLVESVGAQYSSFDTFVQKLKRQLQKEAKPGKRSVAFVIQYTGMSWHSSGAGSSDVHSSVFSSNSWHLALVSKLQAEGFGVKRLMALPLPGDQGITVLGENGNAGLAPERNHIVVVTLEQAELFSVLDGWLKFGLAPKTCQLLVVYRGEKSFWTPGGQLQPPPPNPYSRDEGTRILLELYFHLNSCIREPGAEFERCTYFSSMYCTS